jgi:hypothetical protein
MRSCNDVNGNCANRRSRLTTAVAGHCAVAAAATHPSTHPPKYVWLQAAGRDVKAITLEAGRSLVLYRHAGCVYCSDVYSTAVRALA